MFFVEYFGTPRWRIPAALNDITRESHFYQKTQTRVRGQYKYRALVGAGVCLFIGESRRATIYPDVGKPTRQEFLSAPGSQSTPRPQPQPLHTFTHTCLHMPTYIHTLTHTHSHAHTCTHTYREPDTLDIILTPRRKESAESSRYPVRMTLRSNGRTETRWKDINREVEPRRLDDDKTGVTLYNTTPQALHHTTPHHTHHSIPNITTHHPTPHIT